MTRVIRIQTDPFKVCRTNKPYPPREQEAQTQTTAEFRRPIPVYFNPKSSGTDVSSQIEKGDLFDFDLEIEPILELLVGRVLELSLLEVAEEIELERLQAHQAIFQQKKHVEEMEIRRLEAEAVRREEEKERRIVQARWKMELQDILLHKAACNDMANSFVSSLEIGVFEMLRIAGVFRNLNLVRLEEELVPALVEGVIRDRNKWEEIVNYIFLQQ